MLAKLKFMAPLLMAGAAAAGIASAPYAVADAYVASRLAGGWSGHFGSLPQGADLQAIARRAVPVPN